MFLPVHEAKEANSPGHINATNQSTIFQTRTFMQWLRMTIFTLCPLWPVSSYTLGKILLWQRWKEQMDSNTSASCRIPNHHSLPLHLSTRKAYYKQYTQEWALHLNPCFDIYLFRCTSGSKQHDVFSWALAPSSIYFCTYLCIPVDLQCFLLLPYKFP